MSRTPEAHAPVLIICSPRKKPARISHRPGATLGAVSASSSSLLSTLELCDRKVCEPEVQALLETAAQFFRGQRGVTPSHFTSPSHCPAPPMPVSCRRSPVDGGLMSGPRDRPRDRPRDHPRDRPRDHPRDRPRDHPRDRLRDCDSQLAGFDKAGFWIWGLFEEPKYPFMLMEVQTLNPEGVLFFPPSSTCLPPSTYAAV